MVKNIGGAPATSSSSSDDDPNDKWKRLTTAKKFSEDHQLNAAIANDTGMEIKDVIKKQKQNEEQAEKNKQDGLDFGDIQKKAVEETNQQPTDEQLTEEQKKARDTVIDAFNKMGGYNSIKK